MKNPDRLVNNAPFRALVNHAGFFRARSAIRRAFLPLVIPPWKQRQLRGRVAHQLSRCFPLLDARAIGAAADAFIYHWGSKFSEDCLALSLDSIERYRRIIDGHVLICGTDNFHRALDHGVGVLVVGSHVGSTTFGTNAFLSRYLTLPRERYPVTRLCADPEIRRFPKVLENAESALRDYGGDIRFIFTDRSFRSIATEMCEILAAGGLVTTNLDVMMGGSNRSPFPLFGQVQVFLPAVIGAARTALRTGAVILPWSNLRTAAGFSLEIEPPIGPVPRLGVDFADDHPELLALCEILRRRLEDWITTNPEQWVYWDRFHQRIVA